MFPLSFLPARSLSVISALPFWSSRSPLLSFPRKRESSVFLLSLSFTGPIWGKALDSRLQTSGMTEGRWMTSGMTSGRIVRPCLPPFCHVRRFPLLSCPPVPPSVMPDVPPSVMPAGSPFCHARCSPFVMSALPFCHSRESGNPVSFFCPFHSCGPVWEKPMDSRLQMSGMTEGGNVGMTEGRLTTSGMTKA